MLYILNGNEICMNDRNGTNIIQDRDPETQEYFASPEAALTWGVKYISNSLNAKKIDVSFSLESYEGEAITEAAVDQDIVIKLYASESISGKGKLDLIKDGVVVTTLSVNFIAGEASVDAAIEEAGSYKIEFNYVIGKTTSKYFIMHQSGDYGIEVK